MATPRSATLKLAPTITPRWRWLLLALSLALVAVLLVTQLHWLRAAGNFLVGPETVVEALYEGEGCGAHLKWSTDPVTIPAGTRVRFVNRTGFWQFPVQIERWSGDKVEVVAESAALADGETWSHVFWGPGQYRITSSRSMVRLAGLEGALNVRSS